MQLRSSTYPVKKLGELATIARGSSPRPIKDQKYFEGGEIPWVKIADATASGKYLHKTKQYVNEYGASFSRRLQPGSVIIAASGTLGYTQILGVEGCVHDGWLYFSDIEQLDRDYLYYTLQWMRQHFYNQGSGAAIQNINTDILRATEIPYPDLSIQKKIGRILSEYDNLIENNNRRIAILEDMAQSLYREWFVKFRFPGHENCQFKDSPLGQIPDGWEIKKLNEIAKVNPEGITKKSAPDFIRYVDIKSVSTGSIDDIRYMSFDEAPGRARRKVQHGDVIWATVRPNRRQFSFIANPDENTIASTGFAVLRAEAVSSEYLYYSVTTDDFSSYLVNHATGSAYPAVNAKDFENADILVPDNETLEKFDALAASSISEAEILKKKNTNLKLQRDLLLPKLISGQIAL